MTHELRTVHIDSSIPLNYAVSFRLTKVSNIDLPSFDLYIYVRYLEKRTGFAKIFK